MIVGYKQHLRLKNNNVGAIFKKIFYFSKKDKIVHKSKDYYFPSIVTMCHLICELGIFITITFSALLRLSKEEMGFIYVAFNSLNHIAMRYKPRIRNKFPFLHKWFQSVFQLQKDHRQPSIRPHINIAKMPANANLAET